mmetsp:Transcript_57953/g.125868  ORF Transcript_57953/g.125868 Transcript_57953/m.125868 type:complete len:102 (+) Transcript_57953:225-530(+)
MASNHDDLRDQRLQGPKSRPNREKELVRKEMSADALNKCHETRGVYVDCIRGRTLSGPIYCRGAFKELNECLKQYTTDEEFERRLGAYRAAKKAQSEQAQA